MEFVLIADPPAMIANQTTSLPPVLINIQQLGWVPTNFRRKSTIIPAKGS
jgi:hypothetical protein